MGKGSNTPAGNRAASLSAISTPASPVVPSPPNTLTVSTAPVEPPTTPARRAMLTKDAIKELSSRGLIEGHTHPSFDKLVEILLNFTGKETAGESDFEEVWEVPVAVGTLLKEALGRIVSEATADATFHRFTSIGNKAREDARTQVLKELEEEKRKLDERLEIVSATEDGLTQEKLELAGERGRLVEEKRKQELERASLDGVLDRMNGAGRRMEEERRKWTELRKEGSLAHAKDPLAPAMTNTDQTQPKEWGAEPEGEASWDSLATGAQGGPRNGGGSYAEALSRGAVWPPPGQIPLGSSLSEKQIQEGVERLRRGEERRDRQLMIDPEVVAGQRALQNITERDLLEQARKAVENIREADLLRGKPETVQFNSVTKQANGGLLYEINSVEARRWLVRPDVCNRFTDGFGCAVQIRERKFPVLVQHVPISLDVSKKATVEALEESNNLPKGSILSLRWIRDPSRREPEQRNAHLIIHCSTKETANLWIGNRMALEGKDCSSVKLLSTPLRCYNCQLPGHQARGCTAPQTCGTCGGEHRTENCTNRLDTYCVTCKIKGHPTWSTSCPGYATRRANLSDRVPDNRYQYYVTSESWSWELLGSEKLEHRFRPPRTCREPPTASVTATGPNATNLGNQGEHPRPDNLAQPTPGGSVLAPRQMTITEQPNELNTRELGKLRIWQQNVNTSPHAHHDLLKAAHPDSWDILAIQEPALNNKNAIGITSKWISVYPTNHLRDGQPRTRSLLLVNRKLSTNCWRAVTLGSADVTAIELETSQGKTRIYNIYNDGTHDKTIELLETHLASLPRNINVILLGDFNRHHPYWDEERNEHLFTEARLEAAEKLLDLITANDLVMTLPGGMPTHKLYTTQNLSRLDNVFVSARLEDAVDLCTAQRAPRITSTDHFAIHTVISLACKRAKTELKRNFPLTNWEEFCKLLKTQTEALPTGTITTVRRFNKRLNDLMKAIQSTIEELVPTSRQSPYTKRWWSSELTQLWKEKNKLSRLISRYDYENGHPIHDEYRQAVNDFRNALKEAQRSCWNNFIDTATDNKLWGAHNYLTGTKGDGGATRIPTLIVDEPNGEKRKCETNGEKKGAFFGKFFPSPAECEVPDNGDYVDDVEQFRRVTGAQLRRIIAKLEPYKAPGPDGIPNCVFINCADVLVPLLIPLYQATFTLKYYPQAWRESITVVLRKPGKPDYSKPNAYRPIALLNVISKLLSACVAEELNRIAEKWNLLPEHHFGGRQGRTTSDSMHTLTSFIKNAWRNGDVVAGLFLDVSGAFPNASPSMLAHNLRKSGIPEDYVTWMERKLAGRTTVLKFDDYESDKLEIKHGIDQGCPLSCIFYIFYNSNLVRVARAPTGRNKREELAVGYIGDVALLARAPTMDEAGEKLKDMMEREGGALRWAEAHTSEFALEKTALVGFTRSKERKLRPVRIGGVLIEPVKSHRFLGVVFDEELRWNEQRAGVLKTGSTWVNLLRRVSRMRHGLKPEAARRLHQAVFLPKVTYAADVWWEHVRRNESNTRDLGASGFTKKLQSIQRISALNITGALRTSPTDALDAHAGILPIKLELQRACHRAAIRLATIPTSHPLRQVVDREGKHLPAEHSEYAPKARSDDIEKTLTKLKVTIAKTREEAIEFEKTTTADIKIFTDGSMKDGGVGAAAVLIREGAEDRTLKAYLGSDEEHEVYEAEIVGLQLGLHLLETESWPMEDVAIFMDNQAVLRTLMAGKTKQLSNMFADLNSILRRVFRKHGQLQIEARWIPGHEGVDGNEKADEAAREAGQGGRSASEALPENLRKRIPTNPTAAKRVFRETLLWRWKQEVDDTRKEKLQNLDPSYPSLRFFEAAKSLSRREYAILVQLRLEHFPVAVYLERFKKVDSPICPNCGTTEQTVFHLLMTCPAHSEARKMRTREMGDASRSLRALLQPGKTTRHLIQYLERVGAI
ncbi:RNA-directed DNA polymerase from mobile element jockey [Ceratobasidium sp. AG-Ba]|nr:RNA-directed DNA polymerase from mobile element jockey [Ceratobasidium sp. AG-Ba]